MCNGCGHVGRNSFVDSLAGAADADVIKSSGEIIYLSSGIVSAGRLEFTLALALEII